MSPIKELKQLQQRKQELLTLIEVQRRLVEVECLGLESRLGWIDRGIATARIALPAIRFLAPLWRSWFARRESKRTSWSQRLFTAIDIGRRFANLWREFSQSRSDGPAESPTSGS